MSYGVYVNVGHPEPVTEKHRLAVCPAAHSPMGTPHRCSIAFPVHRDELRPAPPFPFL